MKLIKLFAITWLPVQYRQKLLHEGGTSLALESLCLQHDATKYKQTLHVSKSLDWKGWGGGVLTCSTSHSENTTTSFTSIALLVIIQISRPLIILQAFITLKTLLHTSQLEILFREMKLKLKSALSKQDFLAFTL